MKILTTLQIILIALILFAGQLLADESFIPVYLPELEITKLDGIIEIDGDLDDSGWQTSAIADNFSLKYSTYSRYKNIST